MPGDCRQYCEQQQQVRPAESVFAHWFTFRPQWMQRPADEYLTMCRRSSSHKMSRSHSASKRSRQVSPYFMSRR